MPIRKPVVNKSLSQMNGLQRAAEAFRYSLLSIEFWISPDGCIREWLRKNVRWSAVLIIPTVSVFPVVTVTLWELEAWTNALTTIASKLVFLPILGSVHNTFAVLGKGVQLDGWTMNGFCI